MDTTLEQEISDAEMRAIQDAIYKRYGIDFYNYEPKSFKRRITRIYRKFNFSSSLDLWARALKDPQFIQDFNNEISVGLTAMFRDPHFWKRLTDILKNQYQKGDTLNIWHAGCSSGEEVFTLGIILQQLQLQQKARALATDISSTALTQAAQGLIHQGHLAEYKKNYRAYAPGGDLEEFLTHVGDYFRIHPDLFQHARFQNANLIMDACKEKNEWDLIFCRNVLIYFDNGAKAKVIEKFYQALKPGGFFVVGFFDSVISLLDNQKFECFDMENRIFRKI